MADKPLESVLSKTDNKGKEPQKFVYLQLQQERLSDGSGRVTTLVPGRGAATPAHFIPLTAKLNSISVLGSGNRPARASVPLSSPRQQSQVNSIVNIATPRPSVSPAAVVSTCSLLTTTVSVSGSRSIIGSPVASLATRTSKGSCTVRRTPANVVVSSGSTKPVMSSGGATTITVLGAGNSHAGSSKTVFRPAINQGAQSHGPVILHTSKVTAPVSASSNTNKLSPRLLPTQVTNKAVLSYHGALLQTGSGGGGGGGTTIVTKDNSSLQSQPLLIPGISSPSTLKTPSLPKSGPATISIITGKGNKQASTINTNNNPLNMVSVNLGQNKPNMINFKISNGQIQADNLQQSDVLREARPLSQNSRQVEDWQDNSSTPVGDVLSQAINSANLDITETLGATINVPTISEHEFTILKQPTFSIAESVDQNDENSTTDITPESFFSSSEERSGSSFTQRPTDIQEEVVEIGQEEFSDSYQIDDMLTLPENDQTSFSTVFKPIVTVHQPGVPVHGLSNNKSQVSKTPQSVTTVHQIPMVTTQHSSITTTVTTSSIPESLAVAHQSMSPLQPSLCPQFSFLTEEEGNSEEINKEEENVPPEENNILEEIRKDVLGTILVNPQDQFSSQSPITVNSDENESVKDESEIKDEIKSDFKVKDEDEDQKSQIVDSTDLVNSTVNGKDEKEDIKPDLSQFKDILNWEDGVGKLDGSEIKFRLNEFGVVEIVEDKEVEQIKSRQTKKLNNSSSRHHARKPNIRDLVKDEEIYSDNSQDSDPQGNKSTRESDDICCCKNCGCYGLSSEFFRDSNFCSVACGDEHDARELEWDKERIKHEKDRQRRKKAKQEKSGDQDATVEVIVSDAEESNIPSDEDSTSSKNTAVGSDISVSKVSSPWQDGKSNFSWKKYLEHCGRSKGMAKAAPLKLWGEPFPFSRNYFKTGMKLEAIDPCHQSLFCVMTVAEVVGFRLRLHFDGFSDQHDYWVNADSPNIYPAGWCEKNGRQLEPPLGVLGFSWKPYLEHCKGQAAPRQAFVNKTHTTMIPPNNFRVGMKLEAEDRKNMWVCVATVADLLDNRLLVHFDGWEKAYDVWYEVSSPYIHPIGWCAANNIVLHPPNDYPNPDSFNWHEYLQETNSMAVPARAFKTRPRKEFKPNMKVEVVDKRNPCLIRVATIVDVQDHQLKIHFDGWAEDYDYWIDDDSPELHPPFWCYKTGHRLQMPLLAEQKSQLVDSGIGCGTPGCIGIGHVKGPIYTTHHTAFGCPYSPQNLNKDPDSIIPDRVQISSERKKGKLVAKVRLDLRPDLSKKPPSEPEEGEGQKKRVRKRRKFFDELTPPESTRASKVAKLNLEDVNKTPSLTSHMQQSPIVSDIPIMSSTPGPSTSNQTSIPLPGQSDEASDQAVDMIVHQSVFNPGYNPQPVAPTPHSWERHRHLTAPLGDAKKTEVEMWSSEQVQDMVSRIPGCEQVASIFISEQIDGEALLMMTQSDLVSLLHLKLGPAIKIMAVIMCLKSS